MNAKTDAPATSLVAQLRQIGTRNLVRFALLTTIVWGLVSAFSVYQIVQERTRFFRFLIEANQETIVSGQWRPFFEGLEREGGGFKRVKICWGETSEQECGPLPPASPYSSPVEVPLMNAGKPLVWVRAEISLGPAIKMSAIILLALLLTGLAGTGLMVRLKRDSDQAGADLAQAMSDAVTRGDRHALARLPDEIRPLGEALVGSIVDLQQSREREAVGKALWETSTQVAHDIRSPLAALKSAAADIELPEERRVLIRGAVARIDDIANDLLEKHRVAPQAAQGVSVHLLSGLIDPVVSEKRLQFRAQPNIQIEAELDAASYGLFARVQPVEFKRVVSNLINNAVEAMTGRAGRVRVVLSTKADHVAVAIHDEGAGISPEIVAKLGERGASHGKTGGHGLGLHHARASAESWGGSLEIASEKDRGTSVSLVLPQAEAPGWFVPALEIPRRGAVVVVLDDDPSIHGVWDARLQAAGLAPAECVTHAHSPEKLQYWKRTHHELAERAIYLLDYELRGYQETGLDMAQELGAAARTILVTSRHEEPEVQKRCAELHIRLIPKGLVGFVPISLTSDETTSAADLPMEGFKDERWDAILIDDDSLVRVVWERAAKIAGKRLKTFATAQQFLKEADTIDRQSVVYVDSQLKNEAPGEESAGRIHALGFKNIFMATGRNASAFEGLTYLRGVIGKEPPWKDGAA